MVGKELCGRSVVPPWGGCYAVASEREPTACGGIIEVRSAAGAGKSCDQPSSISHRPLSAVATCIITFADLWRFWCLVQYFFSAIWFPKVKVVSRLHVIPFSRYFLIATDAAAPSRKVLVLGVGVGTINACVAGLVPLHLPHLFTNSLEVTAGMRGLTPLLSWSLLTHACVMGLEGILLARRSLRFLAG